MKNASLWFIGCLLAVLAVVKSQAKCIPRDYGQGSVVCVCNAHNCDPIGEIIRPNSKSAVVYETTKDGKRFESFQIPFRISKLLNDSNVTHTFWAKQPDAGQQPIIGFGGAFTDASGINIASMSKDMQNAILKAYFSSEGLDYNVGRIPIASCDFSTHIYSYDDHEGDFKLTNFKLAPEDIEYKIPYIKTAKKLRSEPIYLFGSPWSAPWWMKDNKITIHGGAMIGQPGGKYYKTWAQYFVKFLQQYEKHGIKMWGLTVENEPTEGFDPNHSIQCMAFNSTMERDFVKMDLGPALKNSRYSQLKLMINDDERKFVEDFANTILSDKEAAQYVAGTAVHWYDDKETKPDIFDRIKSAYPNKFILATEACAGWAPTDQPKVALGNWTRGEQYAHSIMEDLQHSLAGWVDWNLVLDPQGGPNWAKNFVDAPIIVNATANEFYHQPTYYMMAHFSKFVLRGSQRTFWQNKQGLEVISFKRPDEGTVFVLFNTGDDEFRYNINDPKQGILSYRIPARAIQTLLYFA